MLNILKSMNPLTSKVTIYVPATVDVDTEIDNTETVNETAAFLADLFGGSTIVQAQGVWINDDGVAVHEDTTTVYSNCDGQSLEKNLLEILAYCFNMRFEMSQEAIALEINDGDNSGMYFLTTELQAALMVKAA